MWEKHGDKEEKAEVLNALFSLVFNSKMCCSPGIQASEVTDREPKKVPIIQADLLHYLGA